MKFVMDHLKLITIISLTTAVGFVFSLSAVFAGNVEDEDWDPVYYDSKKGEPISPNSHYPSAQPRNTESNPSLKKHCSKNGCSLMDINDKSDSPLGFYRQSSNGKKVGDLLPIEGRTLMEFPTRFVVRDSRGIIDLKKTRNQWIMDSSLADLYPHDKNMKMASSEKPFFDPAEQRWFFPVNVWGSKNSKIRKAKKGYIAIDEIIKNRTPLKFQHYNKNLQPATVVKPRPQTQSSYEDGELYSETTSSPPTPIFSQGTNLSNNVTLDDCDVDGYHRTLKNAVNSVYNAVNNDNSSGCWNNISMTDKIQQVFANVNEINSLRPEFHLDPQYSACIAKKESDFTPNVSNTKSSAMGMFQVIIGTHREADNMAASSIPGFNYLSTEDYRRQMVRSSLAQTDLHHRVLQMKSKAAGFRRSMHKDNLGPEYWKALSRKYYGSSNKTRDNNGLTINDRYANSIHNCQKCLNRMFYDDGRKKSTGSPKVCLDKAAVRLL